MKKILLVANSAAEHINKFHLPIIAMLGEQGYQVDVACKEDAPVPGCRKQVALPCDRNPFKGGLLRSIRALRQALAREHYDLLCCNTVTGGIIGRLAAGPFRKKGLKVVYMVHGLHFFKGASPLRWVLGWPMERLLMNRADAVCTINEEDFLRVRDKMGFRGKTYRVHGVGLDGKRFRPAQPEEKAKCRAEYGIAADAFTVIYVAELTKLKNQASLIRAAVLLKERIPNLTVLLVGFDHLKGKLQKEAARLGVAVTVQFLGWRTDVPRLLWAADAAVSTSTSEGLPMNIMEAAASGLPVAAYDNRGHRELILNGETGVIVPQGDEEGLAGALYDFYACPERSARMAEAATEYVRRFELENVLQEIRQMVEQLI